jgi:hypothetical protein
MSDIKHVGKLTTTGRKCLIAYRTLPGDAHSALVIDTASLQDDQHNALIQLVESPAAQGSYEFAEILARSKFPDGSTMLPSLHIHGKLIKVPTDIVLMTPNFQSSIRLDELNQLIAENMNCSINDLAVKDTAPKTEVVEVAKVTDMSNVAKTSSSDITSIDDILNQDLTPEQKAKHFRSEADKLSKLAADMRRQAEALAPSVKKKKETTEV